VHNLTSLSSEISTLDHRYFVADYFLVRGYFAEEEEEKV
jgi:hypothetical protein